MAAFQLSSVLPAQKTLIIDSSELYAHFATKSSAIDVIQLSTLDGTVSYSKTL